MKTYRSSILRLFTRHCPKALWHYENGTKRDNRIFQTGVAAHAVLQDLGLESNRLGREITFRGVIEDIAGTTAANLVGAGRSFDGVPEPPLPPEDVIEGRDLAIHWQMREPVSATGRYEAGLAIGPKGEPLAYDDPNARYKALIDAHEVFEEEEEDYSLVVAQVDEYKTAWPTNANELDTIQCKGHAVILRAHYPEADVIRQRVINLRTQATYRRELMMADDDDRATIEQWRRDIFATCDAADYTRVARPGAHCLGCDYMHACEDAWAVFEDVDENVAEAFAVAHAMREHLQPLAREQAIDGSIEVPGGTVGYASTPRLVPKKDAFRRLAHVWFNVPRNDHAEAEFDAEHGQWLGLLQAMRFGAHQIKEVSKARYPGRDGWAARDDMTDELLELRPGETFDVRKKQPKKDTTDV